MGPILLFVLSPFPIVLHWPTLANRITSLWHTRAPHHNTFETPYHFNRNLERGWLNNDPVPVNSNQQDGERGKVETAEFYHTFGFTQNILEIKSN